MPPEKAREVFAAMGNAGAATFGRDGRHPIMHRTETIDHAVVREEEITMLIDGKFAPELKTQFGAGGGH